MRKLALFISTLLLLVSCSTDENLPEPTPQDIDPNINVRLVRATDTTISIAWTITEQNIPYLTQIVPNSNADYTADLKKEYNLSSSSNNTSSNQRSFQTHEA